jgi:hypothetical protein
LTRAAGGIAGALLLGGALDPGPAAASDPAIETYTALYSVEYKGRDVGTSEFTVSYDEATGRYTFSSSTRVKGLLRLVSPNPAIEHSVFSVDDGGLRPIEFRYEDGSRKGEDNYTARFDWAAGSVRIDGENGAREVALTPGVLDRGSLQVAVMRDLARGASLGPYVLVDEDSLKTYEYSAADPAETETGIGTFETPRYVQRREGSSRSTVLAVAPELGYLPVRIEQIRDGTAETIFVLESVEGIPAP